MYYVTMTDTFLSGWGKWVLHVYECESLKEVDIVMDNAKARGDQVCISWEHKKPYFNPDKYFVQYENKTTCKNWYKKGYFSK